MFSLYNGPRDLFSLSRQVDAGAQTAVGGAFQPDIAAMAASDIARDRQPQPDPARRWIARGIEPHERPEDAVAVDWRDAGTIIVDKNIDPVVMR
jgi:hypothetical protein